MHPQEMRSEIHHMTEKFLVPLRIPKTVKNEWTIRKGNASNNCIIRARKSPGVSKVLREQIQSALVTDTAFLFTAEILRNSEYGPISPGNTVYAQVTHPNMVSPFSFIFHHYHYFLVIIHKFVTTIIWLIQIMYTEERRRQLQALESSMRDLSRPHCSCPSGMFTHVLTDTVL